MAYKCLDCGNKSSNRFSGGRCPACDSFNIKRVNKAIIQPIEKERKTVLEIILMVLLWGLLIYGFWEKFL